MIAPAVLVEVKAHPAIRAVRRGMALVWRDMRRTDAREARAVWAAYRARRARILAEFGRTTWH